jgi:hypothetical protein
MDKCVCVCVRHTHKGEERGGMICLSVCLSVCVFVLSLNEEKKNKKSKTKF